MNQFKKSAIFFLLSLIQLFLPSKFAGNFSLTLFWSFFFLGAIYFGEALTSKYQGYSLLDKIEKNRRNILGFIIISTLGGIILEGSAQWLGKLWIYPYWNNWNYILFFIPGFAAYWLMIVESYLGFKAFIEEHWSRRIELDFSNLHSYEKYFFNLIGPLGALLTAFAIFRILQNYQIQGGYEFVISQGVSYQIGFEYIILLFIGFWMSFEYVEFKRKKTSLLKEIIHGIYAPLISIFVASTGLSLVMEILNQPHKYWRYINWPMEDFQLLGLPVTMLMAWPLHYIVFLSMFRALSDMESEDVWK